MKKIFSIHTNEHLHWVGDGFFVKSIFNYSDSKDLFSPFLLMDYAPSKYFPPSLQQRGVGTHPHRRFETVTIVYAGEIEHRDSSGGGGLIKTGDVQWMTAASGLVHNEFHGKEFSKSGGEFEMIQLWVNLPAKFKMEKPRYQSLMNKLIPKIELLDNAGYVRIIAGEFNEIKGPASTFSPLNLWDIHLKKTTELILNVPRGHSSFLFILKGKIQTFENKIIDQNEIAIFENNGSQIILNAKEETTLLFMSGEPLQEPIFGHGPFVMNTKEEILQAFNDYQSGKMGRL